MLREQVAASDMAGRDEVLDILDHTPLWIYDDDNRIVDGRKKQLMDLQGGKPYNYMLEHFFPELRNSVSTVLYLHIVAQQDSETEPEPIAVVPPKRSGCRSRSRCGCLPTRRRCLVKRRSLRRFLQSRVARIRRI